MDGRSKKHCNRSRRTAVAIWTTCRVILSR